MCCEESVIKKFVLSFQGFDDVNVKCVPNMMEIFV